MVGGVHFAIACAAGVADCQSGAGRRTTGVGAVFAAGFALAVYVAMLKCDRLEGVAQVFSYLPGCCAVIMESHGLFLIAAQHQINLTRIILLCNVEMITAIEGDVALSGQLQREGRRIIFGRKFCSNQQSALLNSRHLREFGRGQGPGTAEHISGDRRQFGKFYGCKCCIAKCLRSNCLRLGS